MDAAHLLQAAWFRAQGLDPAPDDTIHAEDDMARPDVQRLAPERARAAYMRSGFEAYTVFKHVLGLAGRRLADEAAVLDFACGYGRLLRLLRLELAAERLDASDILARAVDFVGTTFGVGAFPSAAEPEAIAFPRRYSSIWVGSLFSHLPRSTFGRFLTTLSQALEPGGLLLFSTHTPEVLPREARAADGFTFLTESESRILDLEQYGSSFIEPAVVRGIADACGVTYLGCLERDVWNIQDVHLVTRGPAPKLANLGPTPLPRGKIVDASLQPDGQAVVRGYVRTPSASPRVGALRLFLDEKRSVQAELDIAPQTAPAAEGGARFLDRTWVARADATTLGSGWHTLCAVAEGEGLVRSAFDAYAFELP